MDLDLMIKRASAEIEDIEAQLRVAHARLGELVTIRERLRRAEERYAPPSPSDTPSGEASRPETAAPDNELAEYGIEVTAVPVQTDLVIAALQGFTRAANAQQIGEKLAAAGHELTKDQVRSALGYLLRKKRVTRPKPGMWRLPAAPVAPASFSPAASTALLSRAGENGSASHAPFSPGRS